jgi:hypothetical protein
MSPVARFQAGFAWAGAVLALTVVAPRLLHAQLVTPSDTMLRAACHRVQAALAQRASGEAYNHAVTNLKGCPAIAPEALRTEWERPPHDSTALRVLGEATGMIRDRRLLAAVMQVATTPGRSQTERIAAFRALVAYADPSLVLWLRNLSQPGLPGGSYVTVGVLDHPTAVEGVEPLGANVRSEVLQTFARLGQTDADPTVRAISARIAERVAEMNSIGLLGPVHR